MKAFNKYKKLQFLFEELVKRDFKQKYKGTVLGMLWSILSPLLTLFVMKIVFSQFFGARMEHYTTYLFCGNLVLSYYRESTNAGMRSLVMNAGIFSKVNVPKYLFLLSKNVSILINFGLTLVVFFIFCIIDKITFTWKFFLLIFPICCLIALNVGVGLILSALFVFFKDISYLYDVFLLLLTYLSAVFYDVEMFSPGIQHLFLLNPVYCYINYFRLIVIHGTIPSIQYHLLCIFYASIVLLIGGIIYKKNNYKFLYYI